MKKFIVENFTVIVLVIMLFTFFKSCGDSRDITQIKKDITSIKNNTYTKDGMDTIIKIEGLKTEKRMIQSTDRKILDVNRQTQIDKEINSLERKTK